MFLATDLMSSHEPRTRILQNCSHLVAHRWVTATRPFARPDRWIELRPEADSEVIDDEAVSISTGETPHPHHDLRPLLTDRR